jgi:hypothetical protein
MKLCLSVVDKKQNLLIPKGSDEELSDHLKLLSEESLVTYIDTKKPELVVPLTAKTTLNSALVNRQM